MKIQLDCPVDEILLIEHQSLYKYLYDIYIFLNLELKPLIYWPSTDETHTPSFSGTLNKSYVIGDCTEQYIEHYKTSDAQYQTYST